MVRGQRPQTVRRQELVLIEELLEEPLQAIDADDPEQEAPIAWLTAQQPAFAELLGAAKSAGPDQPGELLPDGPGSSDGVLVDHDGGEEWEIRREPGV